MSGAARDNAKSHPYFTQKIKLHSFHAQQAFDRGFELCANAIFSLSVVLRIIGTDEQAHEVEGLVDERLNKMFEDRHIDGIEELQDQVGHMTLPIFLTPQVGG